MYNLKLLTLFIYLNLFCNFYTQAAIVDFPRWHLDDEIKMDIRSDGINIIMHLKNVGTKDRNIASTLLDKQYILSRILHVSFVDVDSTRGQVAEFRMRADGIIGVNSEAYYVNKMTLKPGNELEVVIDFVNALNSVDNKKLKKHLAQNGARFRLYLTLSLSDFGVDSDCSIRYTLSDMTFDNISQKAILTSLK